MSHRRTTDGVGRAAAALGAILWCAQPAGPASADALAGLEGSWAASPSDPPAMEWARTDGDGFSVAWTPPGGEATTVAFAPAGRPNVYAGSAEGSRSMMGAMFGDGGTVNPLEGGTLFWARAADDGVYLYSLAIDDQGGFQLDRYACRPEGGDSLAVSLQRRSPAGAEEPAPQRLVRLGP